MKLFRRAKNSPDVNLKKDHVATLDLSRVNRNISGTVKRTLEDSFATRGATYYEWLLTKALDDCSALVNFEKSGEGLYIAKQHFIRSVLVDGDSFKRACLSLGEFRDPRWHDLIRIHAVVNPRILELYYGGSRRLMKVRKVYEDGFQASTVKGIRSFRWDRVEQVDYLSGADALRVTLFDVYFDGQRLSIMER